jgi:hypothetical protein
LKRSLKTNDPTPKVGLPQQARHNPTVAVKQNKTPVGLQLAALPVRTKHASITSVQREADAQTKKPEK